MQIALSPTAHAPDACEPLFLAAAGDIRGKDCENGRDFEVCDFPFDAFSQNRSDGEEQPGILHTYPSFR